MKKAENVIEFLGLLLIYEKEIDLESGFGYKDEEYYDFFSLIKIKQD